HVAALEDTVSSFIHDPATRLIQVPVSTGGRVGSVTIFADSVRHRWLVRCDGLAPNARDQAYQLWFVTDQGMRPAAVMPMDRDQPMVLGLPLPQPGEAVTGAARSTEPRAGSLSPSGPMGCHAGYRTPGRSRAWRAAAAGGSSAMSRTAGARARPCIRSSPAGHRAPAPARSPSAARS